jgi:arsenate reductase (glutaredoxin)
MLQIYHNPKCRKSRAALDYLKTKGLDFEVIEYLKTGLTKEMLQQILQRLNIKPIELVRIQEDYFKQNLKGKNFSNEEWVQIIIENPKLLKRPIIIHDFKAVWADPAEEADKIL